MRKVSLIIVLCGWCAAFLQAQDTLSLDRAIAMALQHNHGIAVARNDAAIARNNAQPGNADLLPQVSVNAGSSRSVNDTRLEFANGQDPIDQTGANSTTYDASLDATYTLFDGLGTFRTYAQLKTSAELADVQARAVIENTLMDLVSSYYNLAYLQGQRSIQEEAVQLSNERVERARINRKYGTGRQLEVLNAQVDLNTDSTVLIQVNLDYAIARRQLLFLLGVRNDSAVLVHQDVTFDRTWALEGLKQLAERNNAAVLAAAHQLTIGRQQQQIARSGYAPRINVNGSYGYNQSNTDAGFITKNRSTGLTVGISLSFNIFNGRTVNRSVQNARISLESSKEEYDEALDLLMQEVHNGWDTYRFQQQRLALEISNLATAEDNFSRTQEAQRLGQATGIEYREAQLNLLRARDRINDARYQAKVSEMELLRISGQLMR
ncbi:MAG: TolC family protein [Bacteroidota bacterium]